MAFTTASKQALLEHFPGLRIVDTLGASEALITRSEMTSAGAAAPATFAAKENVRVLTDDGRDVAAGSGQDGVLAVAGRLPLGYLNDPDATAHACFARSTACATPHPATAPGSAPTVASTGPRVGVHQHRR